MRVGHRPRLVPGRTIGQLLRSDGPHADALTVSLRALREPVAGLPGPVDAVLEECARYGAVTRTTRRTIRGRILCQHVVIAPSGVYVVDARTVHGRVEVRDLGGIFTRDERLYIGGRDRTRVAHALARRADAVRRSLDAPRGVPVRAVLCLVGAEWRLLRTPLSVGATSVLWPSELARVLSRLGRLDADEVRELAARCAD
jgi:hypothetical protein